MYLAHPTLIDRLLSPFERVGRWVMDFGFDGFLSKFEEHFGKGWTRALLLVIGLAAASFCIGVIWQYLVAPVVAFLQVPGRLAAVARIAVAGATLTTGATLGLRFYDWYLGRKLSSRGRSRAALDAQIKATEALLEALDKRAAERRDRREKRQP